MTDSADVNPAGMPTRSEPESSTYDLSERTESPTSRELRVRLGSHPSWHVTIRLEVPEHEKEYTMNLALREEPGQHMMVSFMLGRQIGQMVDQIREAWARDKEILDGHAEQKGAARRDAE